MKQWLVCVALVPFVALGITLLLAAALVLTPCWVLTRRVFLMPGDLPPL